MKARELHIQGVLLQRKEAEIKINELLSTELTRLISNAMESVQC